MIERARNKELSAKIINSRNVVYVDKIHFHEEHGNYNFVIYIFHSALSTMTHKYKADSSYFFFLNQI